jgi:hypothetical protein
MIVFAEPQILTPLGLSSTADTFADTNLNQAHERAAVSAVA